MDLRYGYAVSNKPTPSLNWCRTEAGAVLVASEPLYAEDSWKSVEEASLVVVHPDRQVELRPLPGAA